VFLLLSEKTFSCLKGTVLVNTPLKEYSEDSVSYCTKLTKSHACSTRRS